MAKRYLAQPSVNGYGYCVKRVGHPVVVKDNLDVSQACNAADLLNGNMAAFVPLSRELIKLCLAINPSWVVPDYLPEWARDMDPKRKPNLNEW